MDKRKGGFFFAYAVGLIIMGLQMKERGENPLKMAFMLG